jgi:hypothetical protein
MKNFIRFCLPLAAWLTFAGAPLQAQAQSQDQSEKTTGDAEKAKASKIDAFTLKQKSTAKPANSGSSNAESKADAPIGVNEPGVNRAAKPLTVTEEGIEDPKLSKGKGRTLPPKGSNQQVPPAEKAGDPKNKPKS